MKFHSISEYLAAKEAWDMIPGKITPQGFFVVVGKNCVPYKEFFKNNSPPVYEKQPLCNPDGTSVPSEIHKKRR